MRGTPPPALSPTTAFDRCLFQFSNPPFLGINNNSLTPLYFFSGRTPPPSNGGEYPPPPPRAPIPQVISLHPGRYMCYTVVQLPTCKLRYIYQVILILGYMYDVVSLIRYRSACTVSSRVKGRATSQNSFPIYNLFLCKKSSIFSCITFYVRLGTSRPLLYSHLTR